MADYPPPSNPTGGTPPQGGYGQPAYGAPAYGAPGGGYQPPYGGGIASPTTNVLAIISLVVSIIFCGIGAVAAIPLGIVGLSQIKSSNGTQSGRGLAIAGIVISAISLLGGIIFFVSISIFADEAVNQIDDFCEDFDTDNDGINDCDDTDTDLTGTTFTIPQ